MSVIGICQYLVFVNNWYMSVVTNTKMICWLCCFNWSVTPPLGTAFFGKYTGETFGQSPSQMRSDQLVNQRSVNPQSVTELTFCQSAIWSNWVLFEKSL